MNKNLKIITLLVLTMTFILVLTGCSNLKDNSSVSIVKYVEEKYEIPEDVHVEDLKLLEDNKIVMGGYVKGDYRQKMIFISQDKGETWTSKKIEPPQKEGEETTVPCIAFLNDGKMLMTYYFEQKPEISNETIKDSSEEDEIVNELAVEKPSPYVYTIIDTDGSITNFNLDLSKHAYDGLIDRGRYTFKCSTNGDIFFNPSGDGDVFFNTSYSEIVQLDGKTFKEKNVYKINGWVNNFCLVGDSLIVFKRDSIIEYDITSGKNKGNLKVLQKKVIDKNANYTATFFDSGSKDKLYYSDNTALYEYDVKTKKINELEGIDIPSFNKNKRKITSFIEMSEHEFLATVSDSSNNKDEFSIIKFTNDPQK